MSKPAPEVARSRASAAANHSWARTRDRSARTAPARAARWAKYLERARELQGPEATPEAVEKAAEHLYRADMARMSVKAAKARKAKTHLTVTAAGQAAIDRLADELEGGAGDA